MSQAFGIQFILVNDVQQYLDPTKVLGGPWIHLATVVRGFREYCCFKHAKTGEVYLEQIDPKEPGLFKKIEDPEEFDDLVNFLKDAGISIIGVGKEFKLKKGSQ